MLAELNMVQPPHLRMSKESLKEPQSFVRSQTGQMQIWKLLFLRILSVLSFSPHWLYLRLHVLA